MMFVCLFVKKLQNSSDEHSNSEISSKPKISKKAKKEKKKSSSREDDNSPIPAAMNIIPKKRSRPARSSSDNMEDESQFEKKVSKKTLKKE